MRFRFLSSCVLALAVIAGCSLVTNLDGLTPGDAQAPVSDSGLDQANLPDSQSDAADSAVFDPTWTFTVPAKSNFNSVAFDDVGNVYIGGYLASALQLGSINIPPTQGQDALIIKLDGKSKQPVWAVTFAGSGDDIVRGIAYQKGALIIAGTTTSLTVPFGKTTLNIPPNSSMQSTHSFIAKLDPMDGSAVWAISPDAARANFAVHSSNCNSLAVKGKTIVVGCAYVGPNFGWGQSCAENPNSGPMCVLRFQDQGIGTPVQTWRQSFFPGSNIPPAVALDDNGDTWLAAQFGALATLTNGESNTPVLTSTGKDKVMLFALKIADSTQVIDPANAWEADRGNLIPSYVSGLAVRGQDVFLLANTFNSTGLGITTAGGFDGVIMRFDSQLGIQSKVVYGGTSLDAVSGVAPDGKGSAYVGLDWTSSNAALGSKILPAPPAGNTNFASTLCRIDPTAMSSALPALTSASAGVRIVDVRIDPASNVGAVGTYQGATTFDDKTMATGALEGSGFFMRRPAF